MCTWTYIHTLVSLSSGGSVARWVRSFPFALRPYPAHSRHVYRVPVERDLWAVCVSPILGSLTSYVCRNVFRECMYRPVWYRVATCLFNYCMYCAIQVHMYIHKYVADRQTVEQIILHHTPYIRHTRRKPFWLRPPRNDFHMYVAKKQSNYEAGLSKAAIAAGMVLLHPIIDYFSSSLGMWIIFFVQLYSTIHT